MPALLAEQARWSINSASQGNKRLRRVKDYKISDDRSRSAQTSVGEDDPIGTTRKPGARTITFSVFQEQGNPEVDWDALADSGEWFSLTKQIVGGKRIQYPQCQVSKGDDDGDNEGSHMRSVDIIALTSKPL